MFINNFKSQTNILKKIINVLWFFVISSWTRRTLIMTDCGLTSAMGWAWAVEQPRCPLSWWCGSAGLSWNWNIFWLLLSIYFINCSPERAKVSNDLIKIANWSLFSWQWARVHYHWVLGTTQFWLLMLEKWYEGCVHL